MARPRVAAILALSLLVAASLSCSLVGRAVDTATGGAASTLQAVQSELEQALSTLPAEIGGGLPTLPADIGGALATMQVQLPGSGASGGSGGTISGNLSFPSEGIPPLKVVAFDYLSGEAAASIETAAGQSSYSLTVPQGMYVIVAYTLDGLLAAGYTPAVLCGLTAECTDHALTPVSVGLGLPAEGIDPGDWYAPEGSFPPAP